MFRLVDTDQWASYNRVASLPNVTSQSTVNHSITFIDPVTGTHTQKLKRMKGCHATQLTSYLDEFMWRERYGQTKVDAFANIMRNFIILTFMLFK